MQENRDLRRNAFGCVSRKVVPYHIEYSAGPNICIRMRLAQSLAFLALFSKRFKRSPLFYIRGESAAGSGEGKLYERDEKRKSRDQILKKGRKNGISRYSANILNDRPFFTSAENQQQGGERGSCTNEMKNGRVGTW